MTDILSLIGRNELLFDDDIAAHAEFLNETVSASRFLVIGAAGSIGQATTREIFRRDPKALDLVDISENNLVEVIRDLRSTLGYIDGRFSSFALDCTSPEFAAMVAARGGYDYVLNFSALKHVRSEKDPYTLMRLIDTNIFATLKTLEAAREKGAGKYFCVSTDKAANPVNMMGASKRIMEMFLRRESSSIPVSTARFANVAFSDGSLLYGFNQRFAKRQPISAPRDIRRYFVTPQEAGELCLMSSLLGENRDIFFPKLSSKLHLTTFSDIAVKFLAQRGYTAYECASEDEARDRVEYLVAENKWPCYFFDSDTTGEKDFEEFFTDSEELNMSRFESIGIVQNAYSASDDKLDFFLSEITRMRERGSWGKTELVELFNMLLADFHHKETGKYLDQRM